MERSDSVCDKYSYAENFFIFADRDIADGMYVGLSFGHELSAGDRQHPLPAIEIRNDRPGFSPLHHASGGL